MSRPVSPWRSSRQACSGSNLPEGYGRGRGVHNRPRRCAVDGSCRPLAFHPTVGQAGDAPAFTEVMGFSCGLPSAQGCPSTGPDVVRRQRVCLTRGSRAPVQARVPRAVTPVPADQRGTACDGGSQSGRPLGFGSGALQHSPSTRFAPSSAYGRRLPYHSPTSRVLDRSDRPAQ
jgi:hypothetical protein